jgi:hypothetical protein
MPASSSSWSGVRRASLLRSRAAETAWLALVPLLDAYDLLYRRYWRTEPIGFVLALDRRVWRGPERRFADGTVVHPGEMIGELHLQNRRVLALHARATHPLAVGLAFRRELIASLRALALHAARDPAVGGLPAFHARTILTAGAERVGFVLDDGVEGDGPLRAFHFHLMLCRYHTAGFRRWPEVPLRVRALWLTSTELGRRYRDAPVAREPSDVRASA